MIAAWSGNGASPSTSAASFAFLEHTNAVALAPAAYVFNNYSPLCPLSDDIIVTSITAWVTTAPGTGKSWTVALQTYAGQTTQTTGTGTTTAAAAVISDTNTTATWTGSVSVPQSTLVDMIITPASTPAATANIYWTITYSTTGNFYLMPMSNTPGWPYGGSLSYYEPALGQTSVTPTYPVANSGTGPAPVSLPCPSALTVTKIVGFVSVQSMPGSSTRVFSAYNTTTTTKASFSSTSTGTSTTVGGVGTGSLSFAAGDLMCITVDQPGGFGGQGESACMTIVPSTTGEVMNGYITTATLQVSFPGWEGPQGEGSNAWNTVETAMGIRFPACTLKNFYAAVTGAPGGSTTYRFVFRQNLSSGAITASIVGAATTASDLTHTIAVAAGDVISIMSDVPSGTPASSAGSKFSYVMVIPQPNATVAQPFFAMF